MNPWKLNYWQSGEYQAAREKMDDDQAKGYRINPDRSVMFRALSLTPEDKVKVAIIGQDPYPNREHATGVAFSIPSTIPPREFPPTLRMFLQEYCDDLGYSMPSSGNLESWCRQGVLLWNAIPSLREGQSLSHDWLGHEWDNLTSEIIQRLRTRGVVFAFLGSIARRFTPAVAEPSEVIITSHPSPRGSLNSKRPFVGSRLFSTINAKLVELGLEPIDWRLDGSVSTKDLSRANLAGSRVLPNITGADLPGLKGKAGPNLASSSFEL